MHSYRQPLLYESEENKKSFFRKVVFPLIILFNIASTTYLLIANSLKYGEYQKRSSYVIFHVPNTTSDYYIVRADLNGTVNCSSDALFTFNVTTVFNNIIRKDTANTLFVTVYWLSIAVAVFLNIVGISEAIIDHCTYDESKESNWCFKSILSIGSQLLQKGSFIFPTYFIGIFNYTQVCLNHHTKQSLFILHHTYIGIAISLISMIYLIIWTLACCDTRRNVDNDNILWVKFRETLTCENQSACGIVGILLCLPVIPLGIYGIFVWITSLMESLLKIKAILISSNLLVGIIFEIIRHCRHK
ncbi:unnamed protein product [Adineta ricciae]|uniref:Uncharacterized protein n=1 Tax=Adineta ricciae TaxID=249248 RepID=A0A815WNP6_ADIRI|nr:unnamed protein product [Adineta ricciae]